MLDWLTRDADGECHIAIGEKTLPLVIRRLGHARRMTLRLAPDGSEVRISLPRWGRSADAIEFARSRSDWLARQLDGVTLPAPPRPGGTLAYRGAVWRIDHDPATPRRVRLDRGSVEASGSEPLRLHIGGPAAGLPQRLRRWLEGEARTLMAEDLAFFCARAGRPFPALGLSSAQRRWGSCSARGVVRLNWRLVMAPDFVRRSVVAHEVTHLVHFDHSPAFRALLAQVFDDDLAKADTWLRHHGRGLYAPFG